MLKWCILGTQLTSVHYWMWPLEGRGGGAKSSLIIFVYFLFISVLEPWCLSRSTTRGHQCGWSFHTVLTNKWKTRSDHLRVSNPSRCPGP